MADGLDKGARIDEQGVREGHGSPSQHNLKVKKGTFIQVGTGIELPTNAYSPNKKTGTASGTGEN
jgi:hypothetical protein